MEARSILVVDDSEEIRDIVVETLIDEGYAVACAGNGAVALAMLERTNPVLVLLDLNMPILDGWGFARCLAARPMHIPIVIVTATENIALHAEAMGAAGYIRKPFALDELLGMVARVYRTTCPSA